MKITRSLRSAIYQAARKCVDGASPLFECGLRMGADGQETANSLLWDEEADLFDFEPLRDLREVKDVEGEAELDLYATTGTGDARELERNVYVRISSAGVIWATPDERIASDLTGTPWDPGKYPVTDTERERARTRGMAR